jgi:hypothetical protein
MRCRKLGTVLVCAGTLTLHEPLPIPDADENQSSVLPYNQKESRLTWSGNARTGRGLPNCVRGFSTLGCGYSYYCTVVSPFLHRYHYTLHRLSFLPLPLCRGRNPMSPSGAIHHKGQSSHSAYHVQR